MELYVHTPAGTARLALDGVITGVRVLGFDASSAADALLPAPGTWSEEVHPRDPKGKFAKKGFGKPSYVAELKKHGYAEHPDFPKTEVYHHPSGHHVALYAPSPSEMKPGQAGTAKLMKHLPPGGAKPGILKSKGELTALLHHLHGGGTAAPSPVEPHAAVGAPIQMADLHKIGEKKGSNPGGVYEDLASGERFYVKHPKSTDHARNELLAGALYGLAGSNTLDYHPVTGGESLGVATKLKALKTDNVSQLTPAQRRAAQYDFAVHAWLANWDATGLTGDNLGTDEDGKVVNLDLGGSLLYRAQGSPKGSAFDNTASEWETLRSGKNPEAQKLFGDMTPEQLKQSADRLKSISDEDVKTIVAKQGPGDPGARAVLAQKLIARKAAIVAKGNKKPAPPPPPAKPKTPLEEAAAAGPSALRQALAASSPAGRPVGHLSSYKGSGYHRINDCMRFIADCDEPEMKSIGGWLDEASIPETVTLYRGVKGDYAQKVMSLAKNGRAFHDAGFVSMSTDPNVAKGFAGHGGIVMKLTVPAGTKAATVRPAGESDSEQELLAQRGTRLVCTDRDKWEFTVDQSHLGKEV